MIDFERCYETRKPKNTTQFSQYLTSKKFSLLLRKKGILLDRKRVISLAGKYKKTYLEKDFLILLKLIK
jgi:predicted Ser/Thr protein kinase